MIRKITVTNYLGDSMELILTRPELSGFVVESITGLGPGKADINTTEVSTNDGGLFNSSRLSSRNIVLTLGFLSTGSIEDIRQKSYRYFPIKKKVTLLIETDNRKAKIDGYVESNEPNIFSKSEGSTISIICPNPFFYSAGDANITVFSGIDPAFEFPFGGESLFEVGRIIHRTEQVVSYTGDSEIGVTITIHALGEARNLVIHNLTAKQAIRIDTDKIESMTGSGIIAGDDIIICTVKGNKSIRLVRNGDTINILNCLGRNVDWFQLSKGDNIFAYVADDGINNLQFKIENQVIYEGV